MKVTFILNNMTMGGIENAFLKFIESIDRKKYKINVILMSHGGELEQSIPDDVDVEYVDTPSLSYLLKDFRYVSFLKGIYYRIRIRKTKNMQEELFYNYKLKSLQERNNTDCLICFHTSLLCLLSTNHFFSQKKIFWIHYTLNIDNYRELYINILKDFDYICCVSQALKYEFDCLFPMFAEKTIVIYNLTDECEIRQKAQEEVSTSLKPFSLLTVARLSKEKGQLIIPAVARKLLDHGHIVNWYIIGDGPLKKAIKDEIKRTNVEDYVHLLGSKSIPYPYIKKCDIYVQPSIHEGFGLTVQEAKILQKPIVATDIPAFREQINNGENGILVNRNPDCFYKSISKLIDDKEFVLKLTDNLSDYHFNVQNEIEKIYKYVLS